MKVHHYKWLLIFFMLLFPIQGAVAAILSVCIQETNILHNSDQPQTAVDNSHHRHDEGCHKQTEDTVAHFVNSLPCDDHSCDVYSNMPILRNFSLALITFKRAVPPPYTSTFFFYTPEQPQHPPLTAPL